MKHTHKYELIMLGKPEKPYPIYRCAFPDCTHYVRKELGKGKLSICWKCGETFVLTSRLRDTKRPKCEDCRTGKQVLKVREIAVVQKAESQVSELDEEKADDLISLVLGGKV